MKVKKTRYMTGAEAAKALRSDNFRYHWQSGAWRRYDGGIAYIVGANDEAEVQLWINPDLAFRWK